jgi:hypothetical protein
MTPGGLPHSEIHGSQPVCGSPWLIAAYHVLLRLFVPRHPPYALINFTVLLFDLRSSPVTTQRPCLTTVLPPSLPAAGDRHTRVLADIVVSMTQ